VDAQGNVRPSHNTDPGGVVNGRRALSAESAPRYRRALKGSIVDDVEPQIRELLRQWPSMPAVIAERIGWSRSMTVLKKRVRVSRPLYLPPDPAQRTEYAPGELAQCDLWFPPAQIPLGFGQVGSPPVLVMVTGYARWISAVMIPSRQTPDRLCGQWSLLSRLGAAPKTFVWDNESGIGQWRGGRPQLTAAKHAFRGTLGVRVVQCRPAAPPHFRYNTITGTPAGRLARRTPCPVQDP
jgi:hypothetical protein